MSSLAPDLSLSAIGANPDECKRSFAAQPEAAPASRTLHVPPVEALHADAIAELENGP
jgi:hypothetical protein